MVDPVNIAVGGLLLATALSLGRQTITAGTLYRAISASEGERPSAFADGERVAMEGTVTVEDPAPLTDSLPFDEEWSVGAYVWRLRKSKAYEYNLDAEKPGADMNMTTYASGVESGTLAVDDGRNAVRIDTDWITGRYDSSDITTVSQARESSTTQKRCWKSPFLHLDEHWIVDSVADLADVFDVDDGEESPDDEYFEARAVVDGETLAVRGEVTIDRGTPVLRGTDETPLVLSDRGFDAFGSDLRRRIVKYGLASVGFAAVGSLALANGLGIT